MARRTFLDWPVLRQLRGTDPTGRGSAVTSARTSAMHARTEDADGMVESVCPYCAVGCSQRVYTKDGRVQHIEGNPASRSPADGCAPRAPRASSSPTRRAA